MTKLDMVRSDTLYYTAKATPEVRVYLSIPYLAITGKGEPACQEFTDAVEALYPVAYAVKKICKSLDIDFAVPKLEGLWWVELLEEGKCVRAFHVGSYATEHETPEKMYTLIKEKGLSQTGLHHEIYLSNPRKTSPEKLKTILRIPVG